MRRTLYPGIGGAILLTLVALGLQFAIGLCAGLAFTLFHRKLDTPPLLLLNTVVFVGVLGWVVRWRKVPLSRILALSPVSPALLAPMVLALCGLAVVSSEINNLTRWFLPMPALFRHTFDAITRLPWGLGLLALVVLAPVTEETFFRGLLLRGFLSRYSLRRSLVVSALLFGFIHLNPWQFFHATLLGLVFGWWYARTRSLWPCLIGHALFNAMTLIHPLLPFKVDGFNGAGGPGSPVCFQPLWFDGLGLLLLAAGLWLFRRFTSNVPAAEEEAGDAPTEEGDVSAGAVSPVAGKVSLGLGVGVSAVLFLALAGVGIAMKTGRMPSATLAFIAAALVLLMVGNAMAGLVLGIIGLGTRHAKKLCSGLGVSLGVLQIVLLGALMVVGIHQRRSGKGPRPRAREYVDDVTTRAVPLVPTAATNRDFQVLLEGWYRRNFVEAWQVVGSHDPKWDEPATALIEQWVKIRAMVDGAPRMKELAPLARRLQESGCDDPLVLLCRLGTTQDKAARRDLGTRALEGFRKQAYPRAVAWIAAAEWCDLMDRLEPANPAPAETYKEMFAAMLADGSFTTAEMPVLLDLVVNGIHRWPYGIHVDIRHADALCELLEKAPAVEEWVTQTVKGRSSTDLAWKSRGGGWASTVTKEGWRGFAENLGKARQAFTRAYTLRPDRPEAAAAMIRVAMGSDCDHRAEMRLWFDRAVSAQLDYEPAWRAFSFGLWPRWHGSDRDIRNIGELCLATGRYDTDVPGFFLNSVIDRHESSKSDSSKEFHIEEGVYRKIRSVLDNYLKEPRRPRSESFYHTHYAIAALNAGQLAEAREHLEAAGGELDLEAAFIWRDDLRKTRERILAGGSAVGSAPASAPAK